VKIGIIGAGGVGGYFGGRWAEAGHEVHFLARGPHLDAMRRTGLRIESPAGDAEIPVTATGTPEDIGPADLVVVCTKTWQLPAALEATTAMMGPGTVVFGLQNGVEAASELAATVGADHVLGGTCRIISYVAEPGVIRHVGIDPTVTFGEVTGGLTERVQRIADDLRGAVGAAIVASADIQVDLWKKFLFFAPVSALGSVTQVPIGAFRSVPEVRSILEEAIAEVLAVGRAQGVALTSEDADRAGAFIDTLPADGTSSMQRDFAEGRRTELEALSGALVRLGADVGVPTPAHSFLYGALLPLELKARGEL